MSHCTPEATLKPKRFDFTLKTVITDVFVAQLYWEAVPRRGPAAAKLLLPNVLCVCGTAHNLSVDERSRRLGPSETKCMSSAKFGGAWPDKDE